MGDSKKALAELEQKEFPQVGQVTCSIGFAAVDPAQPPANILDNAVKYSDGGEITVRARDCDTFVRIDVVDHGCGIPEDELCNIWKRFWRGKNSCGLPGVGVGLYLTSRILSAEGGRVVAKSSPDGSTFSVFLTKL